MRGRGARGRVFCPAGLSAGPEVSRASGASRARPAFPPARSITATNLVETGDVVVRLTAWVRGADPNGRGGRGRGRPRSPGQRALASSPHAPSLGASFARVAHLRPRQKTAGNHGSSGGLHSSGLRQGSTGTVGVEISGPRGPQTVERATVQKSDFCTPRSRKTWNSLQAEVA